MPRNVEIKARVHDAASLRTLVERLSDAPVEIIEQHDTFFVTSEGRLKLRVLAPDRCELIYYLRPDEASAKTSTYEILRSDHPDSFLHILRAVLPVRGVVRKTRHLYHIGQTRVHLDTVEGLGEFIELEVVLSGEQSSQEGQQIARRLMEEMSLSPDDLVRGAYIDLQEGTGC